MSASGRLLEITGAFVEAGLRFLIMGGHAVRYYGIDRQTFDFDFRLSAEDAPELVNRLDDAVKSVLSRVTPGSARHLAVVEAVRLAYQRAAKVADQADKRRARGPQS